MDDLRCKFCGGKLGAIENQVHGNPDFAQYRTCLKCKHQWARGKWNWLKESLPQIKKEFDIHG